MTGTEQARITERLASATTDDLIADPKSFGMPTFAEFASNPDKYRKPVDELLRIADKGSAILSKLKEHRYYFEGYPCANLEEVERVAKNEGVTPDQFKMKTGLESVGAGQFRAHVFFHREGWNMPSPDQAPGEEHA